jgi:hypothetical protein
MSVPSGVLVVDRDLAVLNERELQLQLDGFETARTRMVEEARSFLPTTRLMVLGLIDGGPARSLERWWALRRPPLQTLRNLRCSCPVPGRRRSCGE